jgi:hypothetical protein
MTLFPSITIKIPVPALLLPILIIKYVQKYKGHRIIRTRLKEKNKVGSLTFFNMKPDYNDTVIKIVWYGHKDRQIGQ